MKTKWIANGGFLAAQVFVLLLGFNAHRAPIWLVITLTVLACSAIFATSVANYAEGLSRGAQNAREAMIR